MEKSEKMRIAVELLKDSHGYVNGEHSATSFDFIYDEEDESIEVFNADDSDNAFYWTERITAIANALGLSFFPNVFGYTYKDGKEITFPLPKVLYHIF